MEQTYSDKIVSLHLEKCERTHCKNRKICYHVNKHIITNTSSLANIYPFEFSIKKILKLGCKVYESICIRLTDRHLDLLQEFKNYNVTIPYDLMVPELSNYRSQVQVSVYDKSQIYNIGNTFWKLFLIKDNITLNEANSYINMNIPQMHYILALDYIKESKVPITVLVGKKLEKTVLSLDSCLTSWILNGRCPYKHYNYIDLTYDGTLRTCPYSKKGMDITKLTMPFEALFDIEPSPCECEFKKMLEKKGDKNEI